MIVPVMAISNLVLTRQIYSNGQTACMRIIVNQSLLAHGQDAQDLSNFKHPIVSTFYWYKFYNAKFYLKKFIISLSHVELPIIMFSVNQNG